MQRAAERHFVDEIRAARSEFGKPTIGRIVTWMDAYLKAVDLVQQSSVADPAGWESSSPVTGRVDKRGEAISNLAPRRQGTRAGDF